MTGRRCRFVCPAGAGRACVLLAFKYLKHRIPGVDGDETHRHAPLELQRQQVSEGTQGQLSRHFV